jgi:hypothetical protein
MMNGIPDTVTLGWLFAGFGALATWICITRMIALREKHLGSGRKISEWIILSVFTLIERHD